ncbi:hypothetical protein EJ377_23315 [Chryseobacterium arthrosphaerae]|uniref:Uncharacterized protein n=1 Tax=Chryseobacterium arthrosphaerae TaxID=651561 RepID=A0A432DUQ6_9FLAO|nr:hypothetical protein EJ377_23315 [Chryseobacterium arthrosphaerae]
MNTFIQYNKNEILAGCSDGLYSVHPESHTIKPIQRNIHIKNIIRTKDNLIWVTTDKDGFYLFRNQKLIKMPNDRNNYLQSAHYILEDRRDLTGYLPITDCLRFLKAIAAVCIRR